MKIVDNRVVKSVPFGYVRLCEVFHPVDNDVYGATVYMRIPEIEDHNGDYLNAVDLDEGFLTWFEISEQVELLNATLHIDSKGE